MTSQPEDVSAREAHDAVARGEGLLVDVREQDEYDEYHVAGALLIPMGQVIARVAEIPDDRDVYVHCKVGARSARVVDYLRRQGRERAFNVVGGIDAWVDAGLPVER